MHFVYFAGICFLSFFAILDEESVPLQDNQTAKDQMQGKGNMPIGPSGSLADITNSTYTKHTHMTNKVPPSDLP